MQSEVSWDEVTALFGKVQHVSIATVDADGTPRVSPIGSVLFSEEGCGYYFEKFPKSMRSNLDRDPRMSIMAVHPGIGFWVGALWRGRFKAQSAIRLVCEAGERRKATQEERNAWLTKVRPFRFFKGHDMLWKDMSDLREFKVIRVEPVELGTMNP
ncbi:Pyridoxamine 5'-phosphate oxidase [Maridesulfovibrio ferrireducens]|uniref:Pyridoxamine 5'-phosphate oxidase n=1 Tax=Maridesulfovibrio ferrireducens TaxID=246191 RepID=A0A1G9HIB4_9BACT|nr:pyridoxamine 5'-phosphate oxidase family protein [Maridesulfovibrio ferrireducens]SDL12253.1 Pyridoxamine 5'-phosphate oxidase [Maridesulfovibrio ferrireducens]